MTDERLKEIYDDISSDKAMLRRKDTSYGYVTAWFMWQLQGMNMRAARLRVPMQNF